MNIVNKYINSSIWFHVINVSSNNRHVIKDPFTKSFKNYDNKKSVIIEFDCTYLSKTMLASALKPHYRKLYFKFKDYTILIFNVDATYSYYKDNIFTIEFIAEDVILNNTEVKNEYS